MLKTLLYLALPLTLLAQGGFRGPGRYEIMSPLSNKVIDMDSNDQRTVIQFDSRRTDNQMWDIEDAGGGFYFIRNARNGNALAVQNNGNSVPLIAEPFSGSANQRWKIEGGENGAAILVNQNGKVIDIPYGSTNNGVKLNSYNRNNEINQRWQFNEVRGGGLNSGANRRRDDGVWNRNRDRDRDRNRDNSRYDTGRGGNSRYDTPGAGGVGSTRPDINGMYYDERERTYKLEGDGVCFYSDRDFRGEAVCVRRNADRPSWNANFNTIGSIRIFGRIDGVQIFDRENFRGNSIEVTRDERDLSVSRNNNLRNPPRSMRVH